MDKILEIIGNVRKTKLAIAAIFMYLSWQAEASALYPTIVAVAYFVTDAADKIAVSIAGKSSEEVPPTA